MRTLFFTGEHCAACRAAKKDFPLLQSVTKIEELAIESPTGKSTAMQYHIMSIPTVLLVDNDVVKKQFTGSTCVRKAAEYVSVL